MKHQILYEHVQAFVEQDNIKNILVNKEITEEVHTMVSNFLPRFHIEIKDYIMEHRDEFIGDSLEDIFENMVEFASNCLYTTMHDIDNYYQSASK